MVNFKDLVAEGFGSLVKRTSFNLDQEGLNVIRGKVGSGKTSIPNALTWCLFGLSLKEKSSVETWEEIRPKSYRGCYTEVNFTTDNIKYQIIRCLKFKGKIGKVKGNSNIFIFIDGELHTSSKGKKAQQAFINEILGYTYNLFKSSIVFGQKMKRIIEESGPDKKKVFEEAFNLEFIKDAKAKTSEEVTKLKATLEEINNDLDNKAERLEDIIENINDAKGYEKNFEKQKKKDLKDLRVDLFEIKAELNTVPAKAINTKPLAKAISKAEKKHESGNQVNRDITDAQRTIAEIHIKKGTIKELLKKKPKLCPSCKQPLSDKGYKQMKKDKKIELSALEQKEIILKILANAKMINITKVKEQIAIGRKDLEKANIHNNDIERQSKANKKLEEKKSKLESKIDTLENKKLKSKLSKYKKKKKKLAKLIKTLKKQIISVNEELEIKKWLVDDPLGNSGLKAYMFDSLMNNINEKLGEYSKTLGFQVEFGIDLESHRKDFYQLIYYDGIIIPYEDLSGGQKQLVDTSIAFAIHDVISSIKPTNIVFLDEPFESLGIDEVELIEELVENKSRDKCLFLITHHQSFSPVHANDIFVTRNKKKFTKIS